jgi:maltose/moltooligosaccharide transporter
VGIAWASILSMPYAMLSMALPRTRIGVYMGIFNFFIVIPEIIAALTFGPASRAFFGEGNANAPLYFVMIGGASLLAAAVAVHFVQDTDEHAYSPAMAKEPLLSPQPSVQPVPSEGLPGTS